MRERSLYYYVFVNELYISYVLCKMSRPVLFMSVLPCMGVKGGMLYISLHNCSYKVILVIFHGYV